MSFCLPKEFANKFIQSLKDGKIDPEKMSQMSSEERRGYLEKIVGKDDAREVNALYESKLLLKDQKRGLVSWAKKVSGISETARRDIISRIEKMDKILTPENQKVFLEDLASKKLGTDVTFEEAKQIADLSKQVSETKAKIQETDPAGSPSRLDYGAKVVALQNLVNEMKLSNSEFTWGGLKNELKTNPVGTIKEKASDLAGIAKGMKASLDDSAVFRQGWKTVFTNPKIWADNAVKSFQDIYSQLKIKATDNRILDGVNADIQSRPNAMNGLYGKMKLDIGNMEEVFPTTLPEKIPIFDRLYKASEVAYTAFLRRMRADIADKYIQIAKDTKVDLTDDFQVRSMGKVINSLTGRGDLGKFERISGELNTVFFSPKMVKAQFNFLTAHTFDIQGISYFARKQAATNLLKVISGTAVILGTAKALNPDSVDFDPRSSNFGKIKVGNTRFDMTGGASSLVTLASRMINGSTKSSTTGKITSLTTGKFGMPTRQDVFYNFIEGKFSPAISVIKELAQGKTFNGQKPTVGGELVNLAVPLPVSNIWEVAQNPNGANVVLTAIADGLGMSTNTY